MQFWSFLLCIYGVVIVSEAETCQETAPELYAFALCLLPDTDL